MTDQTSTPESARELLDRHGLPEDVIDGALSLHAQELAAVQRREAAVWGVDTAAGKHILAAAALIDPTRTAPAAVPVPSPADQTAVERALDALKAGNHITARYLLESALSPAAAVLAVLPEQTDRAAVLLWAADLLEERNPDPSADFSEGVDWALETLRRVAAEEQPAETQTADPQAAAPGPWLVQTICCGRDDGVIEFATWEAADSFREDYVDSARIADHERSGIIRRKSAPAAEEQPAETQGGFELRGTAEIRGAVLLEAANALAALGPTDSLVSAPKAWNEAIGVLRNMSAAECAHGPERHGPEAGCIECRCNSTRGHATERPAVGEQPETRVATLHAIPLPGSNGISACCGRPPCEFVGERVTRNPDEVTCRGPE